MKKLFREMREKSVVIFLVAPNQLFADVHGADASAFASWQIIQVVISLLLVIGCLVGVLALTKKLQSIGQSTSASMSVVSTLRVGNREKLLLVAVDDAQLLLGVTAGQIQTLHIAHASNCTVSDVEAESSKTTVKTLSVGYVDGTST